MIKVETDSLLHQEGSGFSAPVIVFDRRRARHSHSVTDGTPSTGGYVDSYRQILLTLVDATMVAKYSLSIDERYRLHVEN